MKTDTWLADTTKELEKAGIGTARLDALVLLEDACGRDRAWLLAHPEQELTAEQLTKLNQQIKRRVEHIPLAQIRGKTEFFGREFIINEYVLEPRPESETMIELLLDLPRPKNSEIIDVGTGSGALGITAKLHLTDTKVVLIDIDEQCLQVARQNAKQYKADVAILKGDLLTPVLPFRDQTFYTLLCNLPYVPENYQINQAALNEPRLAIFGGKDGFELYKRLFEQIIDSEIKPHYLCFESLPFQHAALKAIAQKAGYKQTQEADFIQVFQPA